MPKDSLGAHRDDDRKRGTRFPRSPQNHIGSKDPDALKIPARRAEFTLTENGSSPFHAEPGHTPWLGGYGCLVCCCRLGPPVTGFAKVTLYIVPLDSSENQYDGLQPAFRVDPDWHLKFHVLLLDVRILEHQA